MVVERLLPTIALFTSSYLGVKQTKPDQKNIGTQQKMKILNYSANHTIFKI